MKNKKIIISILILIILVILFIIGKKCIYEKDSTTSDERYSFNENDPKYADYVFYDVEWYDKSLNGTNIYEDIPIKRVELLEQNFIEESNGEINLINDDTHPITVRIENGKLIYKNMFHEYTSENIKNAKKVLKHITSSFQYENANIVVLTNDGNIYYSDDIDSIRYYDASIATLQKFDKTFKKIDKDIKFDNIKTVYYEMGQILIAESNNKKIYYDSEYNEFLGDNLSILEASLARISINKDGSISFASTNDEFIYLDEKVFVQKIFYLGYEYYGNNYDHYEKYLLIDRQGLFYELENYISSLEVKLKPRTPRLRVKKIGYKLEKNEITSIIVVFENNSSEEYNVSISTYDKAFDSTLQIDKLLYKNK